MWITQLHKLSQGEITGLIKTKTEVPRTTETIATWNVSGIGNKAPAIVEFMIKNKIRVMGIHKSF